MFISTKAEKINIPVDTVVFTPSTLFLPSSFSMANTRRNAAAKAPPHSTLPESTEPQPKKKTGRPRKVKPAAAIVDEDKETSSDDLEAPPTKKARKGTTRKRAAKPPNRSPRAEGAPLAREPLPPHEGRNEHPGLRDGVAAAPRRTSQQVASDREALRKTVEEEVRRGEEAKRILAAMMIAEEQRDVEMVEESTRRLSAIQAHGQYHHQEGDDSEESFDLRAVEATSSDDSEGEDESELSAQKMVRLAATFAPIIINLALTLLDIEKETSKTKKAGNPR